MAERLAHPIKRRGLSGRRCWLRAEAAGNELGGDGLDGFLKRVALDHPTNYLSHLVHLMPPQLEPEQTSPSDEEVVLHTIEQVREYLTQQGVPPELHARALLGSDDLLDKQEHSGAAGLTSSTDDHCVEDDASDDSTGKG